MHLIVADDHKLVLDALKLYLTRLRSDIVVTEATTLEETMREAESRPDVDLVLLDLQMPGMNGLEGLTALKARFPELPVVMLSGAADGVQIRDALNHGAAGFIPKSLSGKAMLKALELVLSGEVFVPSMALNNNEPETAAQATPSAEPLAADNPLTLLTPREREVMALLVKGYPNKQIARSLGLKDATAAFHLKSVFRKIGVNSRTEAVVKALKLGWSL